MWTCPRCKKQLSKEDQQHFCVKPESIDAYIAMQDDTVRPRLETVRIAIREAIPHAEERISWSMPTFWKGQNIIHFAAAKKHIGLYPGGRSDRGVPGTAQRVRGQQRHDPPAAQQRTADRFDPGYRSVVLRAIRKGISDAIRIRRNSA